MNRNGLCEKWRSLTPYGTIGVIGVIGVMGVIGVIGARPVRSSYRPASVRVPRGSGSCGAISPRPSPHVAGRLVVDWSPDGDWIVMSSPHAVATISGPAAGNVYLMRSDGSQTFHVGLGAEPSWRPDG